MSVRPLVGLEDLTKTIEIQRFKGLNQKFTFAQKFFNFANFAVFCLFPRSNAILTRANVITGKPYCQGLPQCNYGDFDDDFLCLMYQNSIEARVT